MLQGGEGEGRSDHQEQEECRGQKGEIFLFLNWDAFKVWMCEVVTPVPASKLWEKLQVFISFSLSNRAYIRAYSHPLIYVMPAIDKHAIF